MVVGRGHIRISDTRIKVKETLPSAAIFRAIAKMTEFGLV